MKNTMLIIDGSALLTASYYGNLPSQVKACKDLEEEKQYYQFIRQTPDGTYTNALFGFLNRLDDLVDVYQPDHIAITFDESRNSTFRAKMYPQYKGTRRETPEPLKEQKPLMMQILKEIGIPVLSHPLYEGDDIIGSLCKTFASDDMKCVVYANDRDMTQLVGKNTRMWYTCQSVERAKSMYEQFCADNNLPNPKPYEDLPIPAGCFVFNPTTVAWKFGILPSQVPDWKGLGGDNSDNIPGVRGISEETAGKILQHFNSIEDLFTTIEQTSEDEMEAMWTEYGLKKASLTALKKPEAKESAILSKKLATILVDLPIFLPLEYFNASVIDYVKEDELRTKYCIEREDEQAESFLDRED